MRRAVAMTFVLASAAFACSSSRTEGLDPSKLPDDMGADYKVFATRCSKCHSLARPLTANVTDDNQWVMYVNRMRRQPGSGISYDDQPRILRFLKWYASDLRRKAEEKRTGGASPSASAVPSPPPLPVSFQDGGP